MLFVLSPAKSLDETTPVPPEWQRRATRPPFVERSAELIDRLRGLDAGRLGALMSISPALAELNDGRNRRWKPSFTARDSRPAAWTFDGDVYGGLDARSLSEDDLDWAQDHLAILSGLYGVLRPLDRIRPYRLEMGTRLANEAGADLYAFWGDRLAERLRRMTAGQRAPVIVNLASVEYFRAVDRPAALKVKVIDCVFEERHGDAYRIVGFHAKRARGLMARHAVLNRIETPDDLRSFASEGYRHDETASTDDRYVFRRDTAPAGAGSGAA